MKVNNHNKEVKKKSFEKHSKEKRLFYNEDDLRWATNELVARHRAERLKCDAIVDIGAGIGFQTTEFAKKCKKVYAIEIDERKIENAKRNANTLKIKNIDFIQGDALLDDVISKIDSADIIFCDPERQPQEDSRNINSIKPDIKKLIEKYSKLTKNIAIELPPQIREIPFECEKEYVSIGGKLNRLTVYLGELKQSDKSAVVLPFGTILRNKEDAKIIKADKLKNFIYEADSAVEKAELIAELCLESKTELYDQLKQSYFTSEKESTSPFFKNRFKVLSECEFNDKTIASELKRIEAKKVEIRFTVDPKDYWTVRNKYEGPLKKGKKIVSLFKLKEKAIIAELINR
jgi:16S rRNA G966 N2-methylase RsmD